MAAMSSDHDTRILVVEDEAVIQEVLAGLLREAGYQPLVVGSGEEALSILEREVFDLLLVDLMLPGLGGLDLLRRVKSRDPDQMVIMVTAFGSVETAVQAMKEGAFHYLTKPFRHEEVLLTIRNALGQKGLVSENRALRRALSWRARNGELVGESPPIRELQALLDRIAPTRSTVLIQGESGTGKEVVAHAIHHRSPRSHHPFVVVNSGSFPAELLESNLFGHRKGAFTGAVAAKKGLFEVADGGSLFFDEISSIHPEVQSKLLRVIQEREFLPLGAVESVHVDVRIIAATNIDLKDLVQGGRFREDLFYRLNVIVVNLPPLRERKDDIPLLANHFLKRFAAENGRSLAELRPAAVAALMEYHWPGNVRELENVLERAMVLGGGAPIGPELLPQEMAAVGAAPAEPTSQDLLVGEFSYAQTVASFEKELIEQTLAKAQGVQRRAARLLGIKPTTLNEKIKRLGVRTPRNP
jgi:DNA-binding NtrC family response regulator